MSSTQAIGRVAMRIYSYAWWLTSIEQSNFSIDQTCLELFANLPSSSPEACKFANHVADHVSLDVDNIFHEGSMELISLGRGSLILEEIAEEKGFRPQNSQSYGGGLWLKVNNTTAIFGFPPDSRTSQRLWIQSLLDGRLVTQPLARF